MKKLYIRIGKTGSTSLSAVFENDDRIVEVTPSLKHKKLFRKHQYDFRFTFVRNPYDRIVSAYKMLTQSKKAKTHYQALDHATIVGISFPQFLRKLVEIRENADKYSVRELDNIHLRPSRFGRSILKSRRLAYEYYWILAHTESMTNAVQFFVPIDSLDFVGKYESLEDDFRSLAEKINLRVADRELSLPKLNVSEQRTHYQAYYDQTSFDLATALYAKDLANFGYGFE